jgi:hypothetical protein
MRGLQKTQTKEKDKVGGYYYTLVLGVLKLEGELNE